ncbi:MAG TPA: hypothetical protein VNA69_15130 [Thermoanaerobaculia bacterium]|nr:hypothetical protein [Thermoanaerobaculia bacterium]
MSTTLLRLGLWTVILVLVLYVLDESYPNEPISELIPTPMLQQALVVAAAVIVAGLVFRVVEKGKRVVVKNRCRVCRTPITAGAMYCREHLRSILSDEDEKTHATRVRR